jgi:GntR family transcriptional regulator
MMDPQQLTPQPLYGQVRRLLIERIQSGEWMVGDPLPNEGTLARQFGVSVGTIRKAIEGLENNGLIKRIQGRGTYVAGIGSHVLRQKFTRLRSSDGQDSAISYELLSIERVPVTARVAEATGWPEGTDAHRVAQLVKFGADGAGHELSYLPAGRLPNLHKNLTFGQDLYPVIADYGVIVTHVRERFCFARPDQDAGRASTGMTAA